MATLALLALFVMSLYACDSSDRGQDAQPWLDESIVGDGPSASGDTSTAGSASGDSGSTGAVAGPPGDVGHIGDQGQWPGYLPDEIPALDTNIRNVMEGSTSLRIFYADLPQENFDEYLRVLEDAGFELAYVVYQDERYPDEEAAKERIEAGDFDAVNIAKGSYRMTITYGGGNVVLDIETSGFEELYPYTPERDWPADLAGLVPQPEGCRVEAGYAQDAGGYQIVCTPDSAEMVDAYVQALLSLGFAPVRAVEPGEASSEGPYPEVYAKGDLELIVDYPPGIATMTVTVRRVDPAGTQTWPSELSGLIPQPEGCRLDMIQTWSDFDYNISCTSQGEGLGTRYYDQLIAAGFTDIGRTTIESGQITSAVLEKEPFTVELRAAFTGQLMLQITDEDVTYTD